MFKNNRLFLIGLAISILALNGNTQDLPTLSQLFSQTNPGGTARMQGLAGAQISLGGEISSLQSNPAGLGMFNRSAIGFTTGLNFINTGASYYGTKNDELKLNANIPNLGVVLQKEGKGKIKSHALGISYNRIASYANKITYEGRNSQTSMLDNFVEQANNTSENEFYNDGSWAYNTVEGLAVRTELILPINAGGDQYYSDILGYSLQRESIHTRGAQYQLNLGYGLNYNDMLYLGANIGIKSINYNSKIKYSERNFIYTPQSANDTYVNPLNRFDLEESLDISGGGVNTTVGLMFRPLDFIQLGATVTSPTFFFLDEEFDRTLDVNYTTSENQYAESDIILSSYNLRTPLKISGGMTFFAGKYGFITADVEMINYGKNKFSSADFSTTEDNKVIKSEYSKVNNYRIGGEFRIDMVRLRGGYSLTQNGNMDVAPIHSYTGGVGIRYEHVSFDVALINTIRDYNRSPYIMNDKVITPTAHVFQNTTRGVLSVGFYF